MRVAQRSDPNMEEVKNLDRKRVFDKRKDNKLIRLKRQHCVTTITANADLTLNISHQYVN